MNGMRVAFVANICTHYRRPLFEELSRRMDVDYFLRRRGASGAHSRSVGRLRTDCRRGRRSVAETPTWLMKGAIERRAS